MKCKINVADKDLVFRIAQRLYGNEIDKITASFYRNAAPGKIWWKKWDKYSFDKKLLRYITRKYGVNVDIAEVYEKTVADYIRVYVQQDFMKEAYGYTYSSGKGVFKEYGNVLFYAKPDNSGKYDFEEFLDYWIYVVLCPKLKKWNKKSKKSKEQLTQRWSTLYDVINHYDSCVSKEDAKTLLVDCLKKANINFKEITDYEIIF